MQRQLREESDYDQLADDVPTSAHIADAEQNKGFSNHFVFVIQVKLKGGGRYFIFRRYRQFYSLQSKLQGKFSPENNQNFNTCILPTLPGKVYAGNKQQIAEKRIPELNIYMKVLYDFTGANDLELTFIVGDIIYLLGRVNEEWLEGTLYNCTGIFPKSFVRIIKDLPQGHLNPNEEESTVPQRLQCIYHDVNCCEIRNISLEDVQLEYTDILSLMRYYLHRTEFGKEDIALNYCDPDGDMVRIMDNMDVELMVLEAKGAPSMIKQPDFVPWELHVTRKNDLSVYNTTP
ncbi:neutrophil cytosol factor 4 isoform X3 [Heptranchias perlo]|uniref:neutrophil cytosol factor 4 isoform X3 n=1 Tax=Heptranchias perlo TaxID=212740 RepID=UPI00355AAE1C